ncbi:DUF202 domain-containing protein [Actinoallomurus purpureus]|uniref:DUF202 domain-containing protein n=1 Tax=Actinoallomurus purpureus TaxID=478114 RepID=UPI0020928CE6|nr:DUF202 domain-containing protein [Actinoallomurus purpureus]MCO6007642.1 DUF202 domain-containing protein [Actinoallomurus purpureus]
MSSGLQAQRTELAWLRTTLSSWAVGLLALKIAFPVGAVALLGPLAVTVVAHRRRRRLRAYGVPPPLSRAEGMLVAGACAVIAIAGAVLI